MAATTAASAQTSPTAGCASSAQDVGTLLQVAFESLGCSKIAALPRSRFGEYGVSAQLPGGLQVEAWACSGQVLLLFPEIPRLTALAHDPGLRPALLSLLLQHGADRQESFCIGPEPAIVGYKCGPLPPEALASPTALGCHLEDTTATLLHEVKAIALECQAKVVARQQEEIRGSGCSSSPVADNSTARPTRLQDLSVGMRLPGTVRKVNNMGAFVDVGVERHGLVRVSRLAERPVTRPSDLVNIGDEVTVWVYRLPADGTLGLSMVEYWPCACRDPVAPFTTVSQEDWFDGVVRYKSQSGLFVDVEVPGGGGGRAQGYVPRHRGGEAGLDDGTAVRVRVLGVHGPTGVLQLTMRGLRASTQRQNQN